MLNPWGYTHIIFVSLALVVFIVSTGLAILYLIQERQFKTKKFSSFVKKLPALATLEKSHYRALYIAFAFFTVAIITGTVWSKSATGYYVTLNSKQIGSFLIWIFFAFFLNVRVSQGLLGKKGILLSTLGLCGVFILLFWAV